MSSTLPKRFKAIFCKRARLTRLAISRPLPFSRRVRQHEPRRDRIDRNVPRPQLMRQLPGEPNLPRLGACIGLNSGQAHPEPRPRRDIHDAPPPSAFHMRKSGAAGKVDPVEIDREDSSPRLWRDLLERTSDLSQHPSGIVDHHIDTACFPDPPVLSKPPPLRGRPHRRLRCEAC